MGLVSKSIPNLINGVSQQPAALRLATQGEVQINGYSDVVDGLKKRPPTKLIQDLRTSFGSQITNLDSAFVHTYKRSDNEEYTIIASKYSAHLVALYVFDKNGICKYDSRAAGDSTAYLGSDPSTLKAVTVADSTFILNTNKTVHSNSDNYITHDTKKSLVYLKSVNYGRTYSVKVMEGSTVKASSSYQTQSQITNVSNTDEQVINSNQLKTSTVINNLRYILNDPDVTNLYPSSFNDEPYFILRANLSDYQLKVTDDDGGVNLKGFRTTAKSFTDLPNQCEDGFVLGVVGDNQKKEDDFYVQFKGTGGSGYWKECAAPNTENGINPATMPHMLKQDNLGNFSFDYAEDNFGNGWAPRYAGDNNTNPYPSFVGTKIKDIFFHRNRLGFLSGENVIFSEAGGYLNFFRTTVRTLLDSDRIDVSVSQNEVSDLEHAIPIQDNLLLFSSLNQFTLSATQLLTPAEVTIDQSTKYECDLLSAPVGAGTSVFFATSKGNFSGVREFYTKSDTEIKEAPEITAHVPKYLEGRIRSLVSSSNLDMLLALSTDDRSSCYVYKWYNSNEERLQSSWSKWEFAANILDVSFNNEKLKFVFEDGSLHEMDLGSNVDIPLLDQQFVISYDENYLGIRYPDYYENHTGWVALKPNGESLGPINLETSVDFYGTDFNHNLTPEQADYFYQLSKPEIIVGLPYEFKYQLSEQVFKPKEGDTTQLARFQLRKMSFNYSDTGNFKVTVDSVGREAVVSEFTGRILGQAENLLDQNVIVPEGTFEVGIQSQPKTTKITITNDSHLPCVFQSAEWEGFITLRNQRL